MRTLLESNTYLFCCSLHKPRSLSRGTLCAHCWLLYSCILVYIYHVCTIGSAAQGWPTCNSISLRSLSCNPRQQPATAPWSYLILSCTGTRHSSCLSLLGVTVLSTYVRSLFFFGGGLSVVWEKCLTKPLLVRFGWPSMKPQKGKTLQDCRQNICKKSCLMVQEASFGFLWLFWNCLQNWRRMPALCLFAPLSELVVSLEVHWFINWGSHWKDLPKVLNVQCFPFCSAATTLSTLWIPRLLHYRCPMFQVGDCWWRWQRAQTI